MTVHGNKDKELADSRRDEFLRRFGFSDPDRINRAYSFQLSGGMNQRVISAMGLMNRPKWVIADEPTKGLMRFSGARSTGPERDIRDGHRRHDRDHP